MQARCMWSTSKWPNSSTSLTKESSLTGPKLTRNLYGGSFAEARRLRERKDLRIPPPHYIRDLRPRLGRDPALDWELQFHKVSPTPSKGAFRNPHLAALVQHSEGSTDEKKALHVTNVRKEEETEAYSVQQAPNAAQNVLSTQQFNALFSQVRKNMGDDKNLFVHDGAVGSAVEAQFTVRVIADSGAAALWCKHMLPRTRLDEPVFQDVQAVVYDSPSFRNDKAQEHGVKGDSFAIHTTTQRSFPAEKPSPVEFREGPAKRIVRNIQLIVLGGADSTGTLRRNLAAAAAREFLNNPNIGLPLNADSVIGSNSSTTLVFSADNLFLKKLKPRNLFGAHNLVWSKAGLIPFWRGVSLPYADAAILKKGDLVEKLPSGEQRATVSLNSANVGASPRSIIFLVEDKKDSLPTLSQLSAQQAAQFFVAGYNGNTFDPFFGQHLVSASDPKALAESFKQLVEQNKTSVFVVNTTAKGKALEASQLQSLVDSIQAGSEAQTVDKSSFTLLKPVSALSGFKGPLETNAAGAAKWETEVKSFLQKMNVQLS